MSPANNQTVFDNVFADPNSTTELLDEILKLLHSFDIQRFLSKKGFYKSYGSSWDKLSTDQKNKTKSFWFKEITPVDKAALVNIANTATRQEAEAAASRNLNVNKHDRARLIHMRADASLFSTFTKAFAPMTRPELDARKSDRPEDQDGWAELAEAFNDYETYRYVNACIEHDGKIV
jgi:hypothetical protein